MSDMINNGEALMKKKIDLSGGKKHTAKRVILFYGVCLVIGALLGALSARGSIKMDIGRQEPYMWVILLVAFYVSYLVQIIIHEAGHLICGLMSGYQFVSFRIGSFTLIREAGKFKMKKYMIQGTAGQCLLMPPEKKVEEVPYRLYHLGGILANTLVTLPLLVIYWSIQLPKEVSVILMIGISIGIICIMANGIPMKISGIANDGYNLMSLERDKTARISIYQSLRINGLQSEGMRLKEMPKEWFTLPKEADLNNPLNECIKIFEGNRYMDALDFNGARQVYEEVLEKADAILPIYKIEVQSELALIEILGENRKEEVEALLTKEVKKYMRAIKKMIDKKPLEYAYALYVKKDEEEAQKVWENTMQLMHTYPSKGIIKSILELLEYIKQMQFVTIEEKKNQ